MRAGQGALAMWWDMAPGMRAEFEHWHSHEHFPERLSLPGFERASRWADADGSEGFFVLYEVSDPASLASPEYLARLNAPTDWSRRMMPHHRNMVRSPSHVIESQGAVAGGHLLTLRLSPATGAEDTLRRYLAACVAALPSRAGLAGAHVLRTEVPAVAPTIEQAIRGHADRAADWIVIVSGYEDEALAALERGELSAAALSDRGAAPGTVSSRYRLRLSMLAAER